MFKNVLPDYTRMLKYHAFYAVFENTNNKLQPGMDSSYAVKIVKAIEEELLNKFRISACNNRDSMETLIEKKIQLQYLNTFRSYISLAAKLFSRYLNSGDVVSQDMLTRMGKDVDEAQVGLLDRECLDAKGIAETSMDEIVVRVHEIMRSSPDGIFVGYQISQSDRTVFVTAVGASEDDCLYLGEEMFPGYLEHYTEIDYPLLVRTGDKSDFKHVDVLP